MDPAAPTPPSRGTLWLLAAFAAAGVAGSLALSLFLGLRACPLCFYQRAFALSAFAALSLSAVATNGEGVLLGVRIAWAAALGGLVVAGFHVYLEVSSTLECPPGLGGLGTAPQQSLAYFLVLSGLLGVWLLRSRRAGALGPLLLGALLGVASLVANPPVPPAPTAAYTEAPTICRPPFRGP